MSSSILVTIKQMLGISYDYDAFDTDITVFINSAFMSLQQLGVGPNEGFSITGAVDTWDDFNIYGQMLEGIKTYIYLSVKMLFDPPANSFVMEAMKNTKEELEWRLREQAEFYPGDGTHLGYWENVVAEEEAAKHPDEEEEEDEPEPEEVSEEPI